MRSCTKRKRGMVSAGEAVVLLAVVALLVSLTLVGIGAASWGADVTISGTVSLLPTFPSSDGDPATSLGGGAGGGTVAGTVYAGQR